MYVEKEKELMDAMKQNPEQIMRERDERTCFGK